jgi:MFS family permease
MSQLDHRTPTSTDTSDGAPSREDVGLAKESPSAPSSSLKTWLLILAAGLLAGLAGFAFGETAPTLFRPSVEVPPEMRRNRNAFQNEMGRRMVVAHERIAAMAYGGLGMVLGLALGVAGGLARRSPRAAVAAGLTGLVLGGAAGAGSTIVALPYYHASRVGVSEANYNKDLGAALCTHGAIWLTIGVTAGLALGIGLGNRGRMVRAVIGGILGAGAGAVIYEFGGAVLFPLAETFRPTPVQMTPRLLAHLTVALCIAAGALFFADHLTLRRATPRPHH